MAEKAHHSASMTNMAMGIAIGGTVNALLTFAGLVICMPCMLSDAVGSFALVSYMKKRGTKFTRVQALLLGALSGLVGTILFLLFLALVFLIWGNPAEMTGADRFLNSVSGTGGISVWLVILIGALIVLAKILISAVASSAMSRLE